MFMVSKQNGYSWCHSYHFALSISQLTVIQIESRKVYNTSALGMLSVNVDLKRFSVKIKFSRPLAAIYYAALCRNNFTLLNPLLVFVMIKSIRRWQAKLTNMLLQYLVLALLLLMLAVLLTDMLNIHISRTAAPIYVCA